MHSFHHHNRIIHHDTDGQYQSKKSKQVNGKSKDLHKEESADDRYRHCNGRNKGGSEILQENKNNQKYQYKCFQQRFFYLVDGGIQKIFRAVTW